MDISISTRGVIVTARQKSYIEKRILKFNKYLKHLSPVKAAVQLIDDSGPNKTGVTQTVKIDLDAPGYELHVEEKKNNLMKAFANAVSAAERQVRDQHKQKIEKRRRGVSFDSVVNIFGKFRRKK
ncbi:MAG: ribosome-associated translation inhibitor RaiA [Patescibacteria group bacterium]|jgi:ribosomal subunit interface protein|nr:ribosome-associated translation inhibitor RaiA [Patescibacteria group bacterium]HPL01683.1 ribosome-associated translation inhibitor RaiA [bacterium]